MSEARAGCATCYGKGEVVTETLDLYATES
jgi:hypothetical protein